MTLALSGCGSGQKASAHGSPPPKASSLERREELQQEAARKQRDVASLESAVLADAKILAKGGVVRGPILGVHCTQMAEGNSSKLSPKGEASYVCLALNSDREVKHHGHIVEGIRFYGRIDFVHSGVYRFGGEPQGPPFVYGT